jgi:hypothetical protein
MDGVRALFPPLLTADPARRNALAQEAQNLFQVWRSGVLAVATP